MTSSTLAALLMVVVGLYIWFSQRRLMAVAIALSCITLGYISGNGKTTFGEWMHGLVSIVTDAVDAIASMF